MKLRSRLMFLCFVVFTVAAEIELSEILVEFFRVLGVDGSRQFGLVAGPVIEFLSGLDALRQLTAGGVVR